MKQGVTFWGFGVGVRPAVDLAVMAEARGFDSVFMVESVFSNDALTTVAGMAGRTTRITIGTGDREHLSPPSGDARDRGCCRRRHLGRTARSRAGSNNERMITRAGLAWRDPREALRETTEKSALVVFAGNGVPGLRPVPGRDASDSRALGRNGARERARPLALTRTGSCCTSARGTAIGARWSGCGVEPRQPDAIPTALSRACSFPTFVHDDSSPWRGKRRASFLVNYAGMPQYAKAFVASGFAGEMEGVRKALESGTPAATLSALSDRLLDEVVLVGPASRCREQLAAFEESGVGVGVARPTECRRSVTSRRRRRSF
jgi:hypothetical protein